MSKQSAYFKIPGLSGKHEIKKIKQVLDEIPGVFSVSANVLEDKIAVDYDSSGTDTHVIEKHFQSIGVHAELINKEDHTM